MQGSALPPHHYPQVQPHTALQLTKYAALSHHMIDGLMLGQRRRRWPNIKPSWDGRIMCVETHH